MLYFVKKLASCSVTHKSVPWTTISYGDANNSSLSEEKGDSLAGVVATVAVGISNVFTTLITLPLIPSLTTLKCTNLSFSDCEIHMESGLSKYNPLGKACLSKSNSLMV